METTRTEPLATAPLSMTFGVEVQNADLSTPDLPLDEIVALWRRHRLLLFRDQEVTADAQCRIGQAIGPIRQSSLAKAGTDDYQFISNRLGSRTSGDGELLWHSDGAFDANPMRALCLYAIVVPEQGGDTLFANCIELYRRLPDRLKERIADLEALHVLDAKMGGGDRRFSAGGPAPDFLRARHPVVMTDTETGAPYLYVSRLMTDSIVGTPFDESEALLDELLGFLDHPDVTYRHRWQTGDFIMWDNRCIMHRRENFDPHVERTLRRLAVDDMEQA